MIKADGGAERISTSKECLVKAYNEALGNNDVLAVERLRCMYELATIRDSLDLTDGDSKIEQIGGSYKDATAKRRELGMRGYEVHHIPSRAVLNDKADKLPTIVIDKETHKQTDSYLWKQKKAYQSIFPDVEKSGSYKDETREMLEQGRFVELVHDELLNIRKSAGNTYDGAIMQYFDSLFKYIAEYGIPVVE